VSLFTSICQIPDLVPRLHQIPCNHYFPRWYNPNMRFEYHGGGISGYSVEQLQESSPEVGGQETNRFCEGGCHWLYCPPNIFRMKCDRKCLAKHRYCKKSLFKNGDELSIILLWNFAFCFGIRSHPLTKHVLFLSLCCFEINRCLAFYSDKIFWSNSNMWERLINPKD